MADVSSLSTDQLLAAVKPAAYTPASFAAQYGGVAQAVGDKLGVDPNLVLGQLGLETGWGQHVIPGTNNLGNIKDFSGGGVAAQDNQTGSTDRYRVFSTPQEFADHYADLLARKYPGVQGAGSDVQKFAGGLTGYAEDPNYAQKLAATSQAVAAASPGVLARMANAVSTPAEAATPHDLSGISTDDLLAALSSRQEQPHESAVGSIAAGLGHGFGSTVMGAQQLIGKGAQAVGLDTVGDWLVHDATEGQQRMDAQYKPYEESHPVIATGADIAGAVANPINRLIPLAGARTTGQIAGRLAAQGAISGAASTVTDPDQDFTTQKAQQVLGGAAVSAAGGVALSKLMDGVGGIVSRIKAALPASQDSINATAPDAMRILSQAAGEQGIDLSAIPESILSNARDQVMKALASKAVPDAAGVLRQAEGQAVLGADNGLTVGQATRDPLQFARERNLRGVEGAGEPLTERFANQNTALIDALNKQGAGAAPGEFNAGQGAIDALQRVDDAANGRIGALYDQARSYGANDFPLDHRQFADEAITQLNQQMKGAFLPPQIEKIVNGISDGSIPFNIATSEQLKSVLAEAQRTAQRASDGNTSRAIGIIRDALENAQPTAAATGSAVVPFGTVAPGVTNGGAAVDAFNRARAAARARFGMIEDSPAYKAVVNGDAVPDNFFKRYIVNGNVGDVNTLLRLVPDQGAQIRSQVVDYLKSKALGGASDEIGSFSQSNFNKALNSLGDAKLNALFPREQVAQLKQIARVAANVQAVPPGAAVNNSNTAAAVMNLLGKMGGKVGSLPGLNIARNSLTQFLQEREAAQALGGKIPTQPAPAAPRQVNPLLPLLGPPLGVLGAQAGTQ